MLVENLRRSVESIGDDPAVNPVVPILRHASLPHVVGRPRRRALAHGNVLRPVTRLGNLVVGALEPDRAGTSPLVNCLPNG